MRYVVLLCILFLNAAVLANDNENFYKAAKSFYDAKKNVLYVPQHLQYQLRLESSDKNVNDILNKLMPKAISEAFIFTKGINAINIPSLSDLPISIFADAIPPKSEIFISSPQNILENEQVTYGQFVDITFSSVDKESGSELLLYSINDEKFSKWNGSNIRLDKSKKYRIEFYSLDKVANQEEILAKEFYLDTQPPFSSLKNTGKKISDGTSWRLAANAALQITATDSMSGVYKIFYKIDDGEKKEFQGELGMEDFLPGVQSFIFSSLDFVGNSENEQKFIIQFDQKPPDLHVALPTNVFRDEEIYFVPENSNITLSYTDENQKIAAVFYRTGQDNWAVYKEQINLGNEFGLKEYFFRVKDDLENEVIQKMNFYIDNIAPKSQLIIEGPYFSQDDYQVIAQKIALKANAFDQGVGVKETFICIDKNPCVLYKNPFFLEKLGKHDVRLYSVDKLGNKEKEVLNKIFVKETKEKSEDQLVKTDKRWFFGDKGRAIGPVNKEIFLRIADGSGEEANSFLVKTEKPIFFTSNKSYFIKTSFLDDVSSYIVDIDDEKPETISSVESLGQFNKDGKIFLGKNTVISLSASDNDSATKSGIKDIYYSFDNQPFVVYDKKISGLTNQREYFLRYFSEDRVGNHENPKNFSFIIDISPPETQLLEGAFKYRNFLSPDAKVTATDNLSGVKMTYFSFDDSAKLVYSDKVYQEKIASLNEGEHELFLQSIDELNNIEEKKQFKISIDRSAPTLSAFVQGPNFKNAKNWYVSNKSKAQLLAKDTFSGVKRIEFKTSSEKDFQIYNKDINFSAETCEQRITMRADDLLGNGSVEKEVDFYADNTPPETIMHFSGPNHMFQNRIYLTSASKMILEGKDEHSGMNTIFVRLGTGDFVKYSEPLVFKSGKVELSFYSKDNVDNRESTRRYIVIIDEESPKVVLSNNSSLVAKSNKALDLSKPIYIHSTDAQSGIKRIVYSFDNGKEQIYRRPLAFDSAKNRVLKVSVEDWTGNKQELVEEYKL